MKKMTAILLSLLSVNAFAVTILSEEHYRSPGVKDSQFQITQTEGKVSSLPTDNPSSSTTQKKSLMQMSLLTVANNATGKSKTNIKVYSEHLGCFQNLTSGTVQYGFRFNIQVLGENALDAKTFLLHPGEHTCFERKGFMTVHPLSHGKWQIVTSTKGAEGSDSREVKDYAVLTVN